MTSSTALTDEIRALYAEEGRPAALGARLLDVVVPAGVALDAGDPQPVLFPPVAGIVPDAHAVDVDADTGAEGTVLVPRHQLRQ